jgi:hypothetical protein
MTSLRFMLRPLITAMVVGFLSTSCSDSTTAPGAANDVDLSVLLRRATTQADRFGLPAIATVFIPTNERDAYNAGAPVDDRANFRHFVFDKLVAFGNPNPGALADFVQPDIQPVDLSKPTAFPNGRRLQDDVITVELGLIFGSNANLNDDHVDANDKAFSMTFPYLAGPWTE